MLKGCWTNGVSIQRTKPSVLCSLTDLLSPLLLPISPFPSPSLLSFLLSFSMYICWWRPGGLLLWRPLWLNFYCLHLMFFDCWLWRRLRNPTLPPAHNTSAVDFMVRFLTRTLYSAYIGLKLRAEDLSLPVHLLWVFFKDWLHGKCLENQQCWLKHQWYRGRKEQSWP